jgi:hypothetical protein
MGQEIESQREVWRKMHKVLILGDSHARGCACEVRNQLNNEYDVSGFINWIRNKEHKRIS